MINIETIDRAIWICFMTTLATLPFLIVNWARTMKIMNKKKEMGERSDIWSVFPYKSVGLFIVPIITIFVLSFVMGIYVRKEVYELLKDKSNIISVAVNGNNVSNVYEIVNEIEKVKPYWAHHTHPERMIKIEVITKNGTIIFNLGRDSGYKNEYWVFYPKYSHFNSNEIGRITTNIFDKDI